jgi:hypothetical protein
LSSVLLGKATDTQDGADEGIDLDYIELGESGA